MAWEDYHKPERITQEIEDLGQEFLKRFGINYERVLEKNLNELLGRDLIDLAGFAWPEPINGEYPKETMSKIFNLFHQQKSVEMKLSLESKLELEEE